MLIETLQKKGTTIKKREKIGGRIEQLCDMYIDLESGAKKNHQKQHGNHLSKNI